MTPRYAERSSSDSYDPARGRPRQRRPPLIALLQRPLDQRMVFC